jgi:lipid A disaccharide synthetase
MVACRSRFGGFVYFISPVWVWRRQFQHVDGYDWVNSLLPFVI